MKNMSFAFCGCLSFFLFVQDLVFDFSGPEIWPPVLGLCAAPLIRFLPVDLVFGLGASCLQILRERALCSVSCCVSSSCKVRTPGQTVLGCLLLLPLAIWFSGRDFESRAWARSFRSLSFPPVRSAAVRPCHQKIARQRFLL
jgi:hypothetical protein